MSKHNFVLSSSDHSVAAISESHYCNMPRFIENLHNFESAFEGWDDPDNTKTVHQLISATGAFPVQYETLNLCCGGKSFPVSREVAFYLVQKKLDNLMSKEIDCMVVQCQTCYLMYSDQQKVINEQFNKQYNIPVLLYPQLLGMALGGDPKNDLGLDLNAISLNNLLAKAGINRKI